MRERAGRDARSVREKMSLKIDKMHFLYGETPGEKCRDCCHLIGGVNEYRKCEIYGTSRSQSTDWRLSWDACGIWNKPRPAGEDKPIVQLNRGIRKYDEPIKGQMSLFKGGE